MRASCARRDLASIGAQNARVDSHDISGSVSLVLEAHIDRELSWLHIETVGHPDEWTGISVTIVEARRMDAWRPSTRFARQRYAVVGIKHTHGRIVGRTCVMRRGRVWLYHGYRDRP